jgi:hypothetical protein
MEEKDLQQKFTNIQTQIEGTNRYLSALEYMFRLHIDNYNKDMSGCQKRLDALEHPDISDALKNFQALRNDTSHR